MNKSNSRSKSVKLNVVSGFVQALVALICGLILPRFILANFGSTYNGIVNSVTQFLGFSVVLRSGLGAVTNAALYKPLAQNDLRKISGIMVATDRFMRKVSWILAGLILVFAVMYPLAVKEEFPYFFSFSLVLIIGISTFVENMVSIKYKILLQADQKYYLETAFAIIAQILATLFSVVLILLGAGIHVVKLGAALGLLSTPLLMKRYVDAHYSIDWTAQPDTVALNSRWDAFAQQLATIANNNVPTVIITLMLPLREISVYSVYYMVVHNMTKLLNSCLSGLKSTFGNMLAKGEMQLLRRRFCQLEYVVFVVTTIIFTVTAILLTPFVLIYTRGVTDVSYDRRLFGYAMVAGCVMGVLRVPYQLVVEAAGHFKQMRNGALAEVAINVVASVVLTRFFGVMGVVIGGFLAAVIRTAQYARHANCKVLNLPMWRTLKNYVVYLSTGMILTGLVPRLIPVRCTNYFEWVVVAVMVFAAVSVMVLLISIGCSFTQFRSIWEDLFVRRRNP